MTRQRWSGLPGPLSLVLVGLGTKRRTFRRRFTGMPLTCSGPSGSRYRKRGMYLMQIRSSVQHMAALMELQLTANDHKGGWQSVTEYSLYHRLLEEVAELYEALFTRRNIGKEAADIANYAMMIADVTGELRNVPQQVQEESYD